MTSEDLLDLGRLQMEGHTDEEATPTPSYVGSGLARGVVSEVGVQ